MARLKGYVEKALVQKVISDDLKKYVKASILAGGKEIPVKIRLKGDWTDHVKTDMWSLRIKVLEDNEYRGMKIFSIMTPGTRSYMDEWLMHQIIIGEGVLTTRYDFLPVIINNKRMGVYAMEEHFAKELLSVNNRKAGPILKIAETGYWEVTQKEKMDNQSYQGSLPIYEACVIEPFEKKRILNSPSLKQGFIKGQNLLYKFKNGSCDIDRLLQVDKLAKFYALADLGKIKHGIATHNQRWYYDSDENRLEPIAYDLCSNDRLEDEKRSPLYGFKSDHIIDIHSKRDIIPFLPFNSSLFNEKYFQYLNYYSRKTFLDSVFQILEVDLKRCEKQIQENDSSYVFDKQYFYHNAKRMRIALEQYRDEKDRMPPLYNLGPFKSNDTVFNLAPFEHVSLNAYYNSADSVLCLENYYFNPIQIVGYVDKEKNRHDCDTIFLDKYQDAQLMTLTSKIINPFELIFKTDNIDKLFNTRVMQWHHPNANKIE